MGNSMTDTIIDDGAINMFTHGAGATVLVQAVRIKLTAQDDVRKIAVGRRKPGGTAYVVETEEDAHDANNTKATA